MSKTILKVENISKQYRLGLVGTGTLSHDLNRFWHRIRGKEDPYLKIGVENDRSKKATQDYVWALRNINFEVKEGEVLGIIGKNGAGKSTLLKILSRVTSPTTGVIKTGGRIASLLEVGTGFHPELTGRENIFLNGAILGMTKGEIRAKLDEIIDFSGCEMYIDTPVKRYSSGMRVRLAFAVAAHLEPDILVVDEVLAVGDAEFQKKAIGKMQDISKGEGRTVLFVSHNMAAVKSLCTRGIVLDNGRVVFSGDIEGSISFYLSNNEKETIKLDNRKDRKGNNKVFISDIYFEDELGQRVYDLVSGETFILVLEYNKEDGFLANDVFLGVTFYNSLGVMQTLIASDEVGKHISLSNDLGKIYIKFPKLSFRADNYYLSIYLSKSIKSSTEKELLDYVDKALSFRVEKGDFWKVGNINRSKGFIQDAEITID